MGSQVRVLLRPPCLARQVACRAFSFSLRFIVHTDGGSKPPPAVRDSGGFERFESCFVRHVQSGKLLAGLFLFLSASSFTPMEVQSRRPLCGIQANLNGSSPVLSAMSGSASCLSGFFFFPASSSFTPMEVQSRRPLCEIQADLNGSSPVLCAMSGSASCLPGFFFFLAYAIIFPLLEARCSL